MEYILYRKFILYDEKTSEVLLVFDFDAAERVAAKMRSHFEPLSDVRYAFELNRGGNLAVDVKGLQRMTMLGLRLSEMNNDEGSRPHLKRPPLIDHVLNEDGDLDYYASTYDHHEFYYGRTAREVIEHAVIKSPKALNLLH
eukprot:6742305-Prymnesium_polylepis.1